MMSSNARRKIGVSPIVGSVTAMMIVKITAMRMNVLTQHAGLMIFGAILPLAAYPRGGHVMVMSIAMMDPMS
jgi:hypothetical protein